MPFSTSPLHRHKIISTRDPEVAGQGVSGFHPFRISTKSTRTHTWHYKCNLARLGRVRLAAFDVGAHLIHGLDNQALAVVLPISNEVTQKAGSREWQIAPRIAGGVIPNVERFTTVSVPTTFMLASVDFADLVPALALLDSDAVPAAFVADYACNPDPDGMPAVREAIRLATLQLDAASDLIADADLLLKATDEIILLTLAAFVARNGSKPPSDQALGRPAFQRALDFIRANINRPLSLEEIARASGGSIRALQLHFKNELGTTPSRYIRSERLNLVRRVLIEAAPDETTASIAHACGFNHLGEFASAYRRAFGEKPSDTRRH